MAVGTFVQDLSPGDWVSFGGSIEEVLENNKDRIGSWGGYNCTLKTRATDGTEQTRQLPGNTEVSLVDPTEQLAIDEPLRYFKLAQPDDEFDETLDESEGAQPPQDDADRIVWQATVTNDREEVEAWVSNQVRDAGATIQQSLALRRIQNWLTDRPLWETLFEESYQRGRQLPDAEVIQKAYATLRSLGWTIKDNMAYQTEAIDLETADYFKLGKVKHKEFHSLPISVEWTKGSKRQGKNKETGEEWTREMHYDYGYIRRTEGVDGDHIDVYLGPNEDVPFVYVVEQCNPETGEFDEYKCMLGFDSEDHAKAAYVLHYPTSKFCKSIWKIPTHEFVEKIKARKYDRKKIAEVIEDGVQILWSAKARYAHSPLNHIVRLSKTAGKLFLEHDGRVLGVFRRNNVDATLAEIDQHLAKVGMELVN
jgi:hypothetical protein